MARQRHESVPITGTLLDERGVPIAGLHISLAWSDAPDQARRASSKSDGRFLVESPPEPTHFLSRRHTLHLKVHDRRGIRTLLDESLPDLRGNAGEPLALEAYTLLRSEAEGWEATNGSGISSCLTRGNRVDLLIDNELAFAAAFDAISRAREDVWLTQLLLDPGLIAHGDDPSSDRSFGATLLASAQRNVRARVLLNENLMVPDDVDEVATKLSAQTLAGHIVVRAARRNPAVMHEKLLIVDETEAYLLGSPFGQAYWDTPAHLAKDARRDGKPFHDVSLRVRGPAVRHLSDEFERVWRHPTPEAPDPVPLPRRVRKLEQVGDITLQVTRSGPSLPGTFGEQTILESIERALAHVETSLYIENQYFTSARVARAIGLALRHAPALRAILVLNEHMDIPNYDAIQSRRIEELRDEFGDRFDTYSLWSAHTESLDGEAVTARATPIYVHTKAMLADDVWATIGSANFDGASLHGAEEVGLDDAINEETNIALFARDNGRAAANMIPQVRLALWAEHLGVSPTRLVEVPLERTPELWREIAAANLERLSNNDPHIQGHVLPLAPDLPGHVRSDE